MGWSVASAQVVLSNLIYPETPSTANGQPAASGARNQFRGPSRCSALHGDVLPFEGTKATSAWVQGWLLHLVVIICPFQNTRLTANLLTGCLPLLGYLRSSKDRPVLARNYLLTVPLSFAQTGPHPVATANNFPSPGGTWPTFCRNRPLSVEFGPNSHRQASYVPGSNKGVSGERTNMRHTFGKSATC